MEECLTRLITVMEIIKLNSIFEVHRSRFSTAISFDVTRRMVVVHSTNDF